MKTWSSKDIVPNVITCSTLISALTAVKADGSVRAWRYGGRGGDASSVKTQLAEGAQYVAATIMERKQKGHTKQILIIAPSLKNLRRIFQKRLV